nr:hypothetical protein [Cupriavidus lacunae]
MRIAALTTVADESRTRLMCGLTPRHATPRARTIGVSVIAALPFTGIAHPRFSAHAEAGKGLEMLMSFAVTPATNAEHVQMFVGPAHDDLDDIVQLPERQMLGNEDTLPNRWAQAAQSNSKLKDGGRLPGIGSHARIVGALLDSQQQSSRQPPLWHGL